jgi:diamine N-acetyltransferase
MLQIRPFTPQDVPALTSLAKKVFVDTFLPSNRAEDVFGYADSALTEAAFARDLADPLYFTFGCYLESQLVGYIQMLINKNESYVGTDLELKRFYLLSDFHGRGLADEMMAFCGLKALELGYKSFWLGVWEKNFRAQKFYTRQGFKKVSSHEFVMGSESQTDFIFSKSL